MKYSIFFEEGSLADFFDGISYYEKFLKNLQIDFTMNFGKL